MRRIATYLVPLASCIGLGLALADDGAGKPESKKPPTVKALMHAAHEGVGEGPDKRPSPLAVVKAELEKAAPDWKLVAKNTVPLRRLADAIKDKEFGYRAPGSSYAKPVGALVAATRERDLERARTAFAGLSKSCAGCHAR